MDAMSEPSVADVIERNAVRCLKCSDTIESRHRHDTTQCSCGHVSVDGGHAYRRRTWRGEPAWVEIVDEVGTELPPLHVTSATAAS
jgi:hypothetical protein